MVAAVVVRDDATPFDEAALRAELNAELSAYKIPRRFAAIPAAGVPMLSSGKVDMQRLKKVFDARHHH